MYAGNQAAGQQTFDFQVMACLYNPRAAGQGGAAALDSTLVESLYYMRRKGSARRAFTFQAVASRYNPRAAGQGGYPALDSANAESLYHLFNTLHYNSLLLSEEFLVPISANKRVSV